MKEISRGMYVGSKKQIGKNIDKYDHGIIVGKTGGGMSFNTKREFIKDNMK